MLMVILFAGTYEATTMATNANKVISEEEIVILNGNKMFLVGPTKRLIESVGKIALATHKMQSVWELEAGKKLLHDHALSRLALIDEDGPTLDIGPDEDLICLLPKYAQRMFH
jgi:hypothetical protein